MSGLNAIKPAQPVSPKQPLIKPLSISAEMRLHVWDEWMPRLAPLGLQGTSDTTWEVRRKGTEIVKFRRSGDRVYASGFIDVDDVESRPLFAAIAIITQGRVTNATGDLVELEPWIKDVESKLSQEAADLAADFSLLPKRVDYSSLASNFDAGQWATLI